MNPIYSRNNSFSWVRKIGHRTYFWYRKIYYYRAFIIKIYDLGLSFLPLYKAKRETLATLTTLKRTPGMSPTA